MKKLLFLTVFICLCGFLNAQVYIGFNHTPLPLPVANAGNDTTVIQSVPFQLNGSYSGGTAPFTHYWSPGMYLNDSTLLNPTAALSSSIVFTLYVTDNNQCVATDQVSITSTVGIEKHNASDFVLYPNPNGGRFFIEGLPANTDLMFKLKIRNLLGELVYENELSSQGGKAEVRINGLVEGMYLLEMNIDGHRYTKKIFIRR